MDKPARCIYADHAATTPLAPAARRAMAPWLDAAFGNASALYAPGRRARKAVEQARDRCAAVLGAKPEEIYFTSGGTEGDNWALKGMALLGARSGKRHLVTTAFEHPAVLRSCAALAEWGFEITYLPVHAHGLVRPQELAAALRPDTALASVMLANNELGTIQPVADCAQICAQRGVPLHCDAVQAVGHVPVDVSRLGVSLLSLSAHKFGGPKGVGLLYVRSGIQLPPLLHGGAQEGGLRAGTENVAGIVGMAAALEAACASMQADAARVAALRDRLEAGLLAAVPGCRRNGAATPRLPGHLNLCFDGVEGESLLLLLDQQGVCASSGSACAAGSIEPSHTLLALGLSPQQAKSSLRLSLGAENTEEDVEILLQRVPQAVERLRRIAAYSACASSTQA